MKVKIYAQKNPAEIPWKSHEVDVVLECTGFFTDKTKAESHLTAGAKKVVISAPATGDLKTVVFNVNHKILDGSETIISCASLYYQLPGASGTGTGRKIRHCKWFNDDNTCLYK